MTTPSVSTLTDTSSAFKYPLPTVRQLHRQLETALDEKNARLRTLVGGSYRQLLGTAETIVRMRKDIESTERRLERVADGCGRTAVGKKVAGLGKLGPARGGLFEYDDDTELGWYARMKVLDGCVVSARTLLRGPPTGNISGDSTKGQRLVAATKVMVLARLLLKSVSEAPEGRQTLVDSLRKKVGSLRRRLLDVIERSLQHTNDDREYLADALSAYSLATSSGTKDTLRHFLHLRGEAIALAFEEHEGAAHTHAAEHNIIKALGLYTNTLLDVQALVPRRLSESLQRLKAAALLQDAGLRRLEGLRLEIGEMWFGDEIVYFTPYIRHDDLEGSQAVEMLRSWAKKGSEVFLQNLKKTLDTISDLKVVVDLRTEVLQTWIRQGGKARGFDSQEVLDELRETINDRLIALIEARVSKLHLVGSEVEAILAGWNSSSEEDEENMWSGPLLDMELTNGGARFKTALISCVHGRDLHVSRVLNSFETWKKLVDELFQSIDELKKQKWDGDFDDLDDDMSLEDRNEMLSVDDPTKLRKRVDRSLKQAFYDLHDKLTTLSHTFQASEHNGAISIFFLRVVREIRRELPASSDVQSFGLSLVPELHRSLATSITSGALSGLSSSLSWKQSNKGIILWEGDPPLPVQPSPAVFKLFRAISKSMSLAGPDLWSPVAVTVLKQHLSKSVAQEWSSALARLSSHVATNGHAERGPEQEASVTVVKQLPQEAETQVERDQQKDEVAILDSKIEQAQETSEVDVADTVAESSSDEQLQQSKTRLDVLIQWVFDVSVLRSSLEDPTTADQETSLKHIINILEKEAELVDAHIQRMRLSAAEYWKRVSLLFGLLA